ELRQHLAGKIDAHTRESLLQPFAHAPFVIVTLAMLWMSKSSFIPIGIAICAFANRTGVGRRDCQSRCGKPI
ncbi:MAG TPA: hypothetical protein VGY99_27410, partial [Candidatus Binataceae bacterium]|nr:hypothetical protein [Candidatus Binataceae bacterium]